MWLLCELFLTRNTTSVP